VSSSGLQVRTKTFLLDSGIHGQSETADRGNGKEGRDAVVVNNRCVILRPEKELLCALDVELLAVGFCP